MQGIAACCENAVSVTTSFTQLHEKAVWLIEKAMQGTSSTSGMSNGENGEDHLKHRVLRESSMKHRRAPSGNLSQSGELGRWQSLERELQVNDRRVPSSELVSSSLTNHQ